MAVRGPVGPHAFGPRAYEDKPEAFLQGSGPGHKLVSVTDPALLVPWPAFPSLVVTSFDCQLMEKF